MTPFDVYTIRKDFPILTREAHPGVPLTYLDSAATSQKPESVIESMNDYYRRYNSNVHRGIHVLSEEATAAYENARVKLVEFLNAPGEETVIFTKGTTESVNVVAWTWGLQNLGPGDVILCTELEHHANMVPWQLLCQRVGATMQYVPLLPDGTLNLEVYYDTLKSENVKLVAFNQASNVTGSIQPVKEMVKAAHEAGAVAMVDGAQGVPHFKVDVQDLDVDFYAFSAHKMLGPTGIGALYGKKEHLEAMPPFMGGGDMIKAVTLDGPVINDLPWKFEAGTPAIAEAIGFGAAIDYLNEVGMDNIHAYEIEITTYAMERLAEVPKVKVVGPQDPTQRTGLAAMVIEDIHAHDVSQILDHYGIAVRAGKHCAHPAHQCMGIPPTARASFYLYNTREDIDKLIEGLYGVLDVFS